jgi:hypothetical protein
MNEIVVLYILMAMANACIIWLLFERDRMSKGIGSIIRWSDGEFEKIKIATDTSHKEIGEILAKLENFDTKEQK